VSAAGRDDPGAFDGAIRREPPAGAGPDGVRGAPAAGTPSSPATSAGAAHVSAGAAQAPARHHFAYAIVGLLSAATAVCVGLVVARFWYSHTTHYWFLLWNLVLAWVPFIFAGIAYRLASAGRAILYVLIVAAAVVWLAFFPNAPYILTDFLHLGSMGDNVPGWYDVLMLYWFAWTGLILGIVSLYLMQEIVTRGLGTAAGWVFVVVAAGLGSFGIYLGRFLRWNSWDLVRRPGPLADELLGRVTDPASQPRLLGFTLLFALLFLFIYVAVYIFAKLTKPRQQGERT